jgi:nucleoside-diphosphate-sugar epimerase
MTPDTTLILGCGFTGERVAKRMLAHGGRVIATSRNPGRLAHLGVEAIRLEDVPQVIETGCLVLHSIPPDDSIDVLSLIGDQPARVVYLSTTGVYGSTHLVDHHTEPDWSDERARVRLKAEEEIQAGHWSKLILRPAAIYGPGRGVHESVKLGTYPSGNNFVSRIHVDDLAAIAEAALLSYLRGVYPVADDEPCRSSEIAEFCSNLLGVPLPDAPVARPRTFADRKVDGSAIRRLLGVKLTYKVGIPAAIQAASETGGILKT